MIMPDNRKRLLIIDDEPDFLTVLLMSFKKAAKTYAVRIAPNGASGIREATSFNPHIVLLDAWMPGMDGWEVCRRLRANPQMKDTILLMMTAENAGHAEDEARKSGADGVIGKPFDFDELVERLNSASSQVLRPQSHETEYSKP